MTENLLPKIIIAIETTGPFASVAIAGDSTSVGTYGDDGISSLISDGRLNHLTELMPMLDRLLTEADCSINEIGAIAVSAGPGSFTGTRIGISTVRSICQTLAIPVIKVPSLESIVFGFTADAGSVICPVIDARLDQVYAGAYRLRQGECVPPDASIDTLIPSGAYEPEAFANMLSNLCDKAVSSTEPAISDIILCGENPEMIPGLVLPDALAARVKIIPSLQNARFILKWAVLNGMPSDYRELEPIYIRKAEAQRKLDARMAAEAAL